MQKQKFLNTTNLIQQHLVGIESEIGSYSTKCQDYVFERKQEKAIVKLEELYFGFKLEEVPFKIKKNFKKYGSIDRYIEFLGVKFESVNQLNKYINENFRKD